MADPSYQGARGNRAPYGLVQAGSLAELAHAIALHMNAEEPPEPPPPPEPKPRRVVRAIRRVAASVRGRLSRTKAGANSTESAPGGTNYLLERLRMS